jgi:hypothetical protein
MQSLSYFYNCSEEYISSISPSLHDEILGIISSLPKRFTQSEVNQDLFWLLTSRGWSYDSLPAKLDQRSPSGLSAGTLTLDQVRDTNSSDLCQTTTTLGAGWKADFAKSFEGSLVQIEAQFGKVEAMFKDFCGFQIAHFERRLALGIEIVMTDPGKYFAHRKGATSGIGRNTHRYGIF